MDINTNNSSGMINGLPPTRKEERRVGPIVAALVVILLIIIFALYFFGKRLNTQNPNVQTPPVANTEQLEQTANLSSTTDLELMNKNLDQELKDIDYSF